MKSGYVIALVVTTDEKYEYRNHEFILGITLMPGTFIEGKTTVATLCI